MTNANNTDPFRKLVTGAGNYRIQALLNGGVQPWPPMPEDEPLGVLPKELPIPVLVSSDGILIDGNRRLLQLLSQGVTTIPHTSVRILENVTGVEDAYEAASKLNDRRRQHDTARRADWCRRAMTERGWSQARCAQVLGVSQPAVANWLARYPDETWEPPASTEGVDGIIRTVPRRDKEPAVEVPPWEPKKGPAWKQADRLAGQMKGLCATLNLPHAQPTGLDEDTRDATIAVLTEVQAAARIVASRVTEALKMLAEEEAEGED